MTYNQNACQEIFNAITVKQRALDFAGDGIIITGSVKEDCPIIYCNEAFILLTGYSKEEILEKNCRLLQGNKTSKEKREVIRETLNASKGFTGRLVNYRKNGSTFWNHLTITPIFTCNGIAENFIGIQRDVTAIVEMEQILQSEDQKEEAYKKALQHLQTRIKKQEAIIEKLNNSHM